MNEVDAGGTQRHQEEEGFLMQEEVGGRGFFGGRGNQGFSQATGFSAYLYTNFMLPTIKEMYCYEELVKRKKNLKRAFKGYKQISNKDLF